MFSNTFGVTAHSLRKVSMPAINFAKPTDPFYNSSAYQCSE